MSNQSSEVKKNKKQTVFNQEVIERNKKKCKFVSKIVNKIVKVTSKEHTLRSLKNCTIRNFKNMQYAIEKCDLNISSSNSKSTKRTSTSSYDLNTPKRHKQSTVIKKKLSLSSEYESSDSDEQNVNKSYLSGVKSLFDTSSCSDKSKQRYEKENCDKSNSVQVKIKKRCESEKEISDDKDSDDERSKLIQDLINEQKKIITFTTCNDEDVSDDNSSELSTKEELIGKSSLAKILELRKLPDYDKIDKFLNAPPETYYKKSLHASLNTFPREESKSVEHWNKYSFLCRKIEQCVLNREWKNLTKLLTLLADSSKSYKPFLLKSTLINFLCNLAAQDGQVEEFLKTCYSCQTDEDIGKVLTDLFHIKKREKDINDKEDKADESL